MSQEVSLVASFELTVKHREVELVMQAADDVERNSRRRITALIHSWVGSDGDEVVCWHDVCDIKSKSRLCARLAPSQAEY